MAGHSLLERISDRQVPARCVIGDIEVTVLARFVWDMQGDTHIQADHDKGEVVAKSYTGIQCQVFQETTPF